MPGVIQRFKQNRVKGEMKILERLSIIKNKPIRR